MELLQYPRCGFPLHNTVPALPASQVWHLDLILEYILFQSRYCLRRSRSLEFEPSLPDSYIRERSTIGRSCWSDCSNIICIPHSWPSRYPVRPILISAELKLGVAVMFRINVLFQYGTFQIREPFVDREIAVMDGRIYVAYRTVILH